MDKRWQKHIRFKDFDQPVLIMHVPESYGEVMASFQGGVHHRPEDGTYDFVQVFGSTNEKQKRNIIWRKMDSFGFSARKHHLKYTRNQTAAVTRRPDCWQIKAMNLSGKLQWMTTGLL
ncbi:hypothetical protein VSK91_17105 [Bacillus swezeyi]|uniref:hypothetical protein n=1 Tax=Bacillus swezeyi TaxID=1925020 RepID=UPI0039C61CFC